MQYGGFGAGAYRYPGHKSVRIRLGQISATHAVRGLSLNLSDVYVFKKVASTLSFTKAARQIGVSEQTYYCWRKEYGGLKVEQARRL